MVDELWGPNGVVTTLIGSIRGLVNWEPTGGKNSCKDRVRFEGLGTRRGCGGLRIGQRRT